MQDGTDSPQVASHSNADVPQRPVHTRAPTRALRSSDAPQMVVLRTYTDLAVARRAFSVAAPSTCIWNTLPAELRLCHSTAAFKP